LVSNYHVIVGRNPINQEPLHSSSCTPGQLEAEVFTTWQCKDETRIATLKLIVQLYEDDIRDQKLPLWIACTDNYIDVAIIDVTNHILYYEKLGYNFTFVNLERELTFNERLSPMQQVFVVGHPNIRSEDPMFPIYKGATIASEPQINETQLSFLVDGKTKQGMSGSPVFVRTETKITVELRAMVHTMPSLYLIGIYSGRDENDPELYTAELGRVWHLKLCLMPLIERALAS